MKKILLSLLTVFAAANVFAQTEVVFNFDENYASYFTTGEGVSSGSNDTYVADGEFNEDQTVTVDGVTVFIKASATDAQTRNRVWATSPRLRMYNEYFTVSVAGHKITKMVFTGHSTNFNITTETGTLSGKEWVGDATSVQFNVSKNTQIKTLTVTLDGEQEEPTPEVHIANTLETAYTVAKAFELIDADEALNEEVYVKGIISKIDEIDTGDYGNATYYISDNGTTDNQLEVYRGYGLGGQKFNEEGATLINVGDEVVVCGKLVNYKGTHEFTTGSKIASLNGATSAIKNVTVDANAPVYNLAGQRVAGNYRGVVIVNGKKIVK